MMPDRHDEAEWEAMDRLLDAQVDAYYHEQYERRMGLAPPPITVEVAIDDIDAYLQGITDEPT